MTIFSLPISAKYKKIVQTMAVFSFFIYISLVLYNNVYGLPAGNNNNNNQQVSSYSVVHW